MENKGELRRSKRLKARQDAEPVWTNLPYELLLHILSMLSVMDRVLNVADVCRSWRAAIYDPFLSPQRLGMSEFRHQLNHLLVPRKRAMLTAFVRGIDVALGSLRTLAFDSSFQLKDSHLLYASSRCPNLRELVLPRTSRNITKEGLTEAFQQWTQLESLVIGGKYGKINMIEIAGHNCPNLKVLNVCNLSFSLEMAMDILSDMSRLKVLKVHASFLTIDEVLKLRLGLPELEEIYITMKNKMLIKHTRLTSSDWAIHLSFIED